MLYDIEIVIPICTKGKWSKRLANFKETGLLNIGNNKILLKLLLGPTDDATDLSIGWPENVDIRHLVMPADHPACKIYNYYFYHGLEDIDNCRWFGRMDDDSTTDIGGLIVNLDTEYDYKKEVYVASFLNEIPPIDRMVDMQLFQDAGYHKWYYVKTYHPHEWECAITTASTLKRFLSDEVCLDIILKRSQIPRSVCDTTMAGCMRILDISIKDSFFMHKDAHFGDFSLFGGNYNHLHFIDRNEEAYDVFDALIRKEFHKLELFDKLKNQKFVLSKDNKILGFITLDELGSITNHGPLNRNLWLCTENELMIYDSWGKNGNSFTIEDEKGHLLKNEFFTLQKMA